MTLRRDYSSIGPNKPPPEIVSPLKVAIVPTPDFTLMSLSCLIEYLRLAADESDFSRPIYCSWSILSEGKRPVVSSSGLALTATGDISEASDHDVIVFHGGLLHSKRAMPDYIYRTIEAAMQTKVQIVGLCTGQFLLAEMGLLDQLRCAVHFSLESTLRKHFPKVVPITDQQVVEDGRFLTCPGGLAAISLGTRLVERYCGTSRASKALQYFMADRAGILNDANKIDTSFIAEHCQDHRVANAIAIMRQRMYDRCDIAEIASQVCISKRELARLFDRHLRVSPAEYWRDIRLNSARWMILNTDRSVTQIAYECGFSDSSHLIRWFQKRFDRTPTEFRKAVVATGIR
jgi:transcriptional regulator GlxA family with amidase domain